MKKEGKEILTNTLTENKHLDEIALWDSKQAREAIPFDEGSKTATHAWWRNDLHVAMA